MNEGDFEKIMRLAIDAENEAYEFYQSISEKVKDESVKKIYRDFAADELEQRTLLEQILKHDIKRFSFPEVNDFKIAERVELPRLSSDLEPVDAIALAMKKKEEAKNIYSSLAAISIDPERQELFGELAKMAEAHQVQMEQLYTNAAFPEVW